MEQGVTLKDPMRFDLRGSVESLGQDIEIDINVILEGKNSIGSNVKIGANTQIKNSIIGDNVEISGKLHNRRCSDRARQQNRALCQT